MGACTQPAVTDTGSIFAYDPDLHTWGKSFQVNEQGITRLEVYGDTLYVPGYDANDGGWSLEKPGARFQASAAGFMQFRAVLATENPALMPYLKQVTVTRPE